MQNFILSKSTFHWFQWIFNEFLWMNFHQKSLILTQSGFGSGSHVQLTKCWNHVYIKNCPNIPKLRLNKNNATYERFWIRFWSVFGGSDLYNKRYSFEQNHKMLNPNHLRNVQPHLFVEISKIQNFKIQLEQSKIRLKNVHLKTCIMGRIISKHTQFSSKFCMKFISFLNEIT